MDAKILDGIRARDVRALEQLYRSYAGFAYALSLRILHDTSEAEEVVQDVFLYVWQQVDRFDANRGDLPSWLVTLARSRSIDRLRVRKRRGLTHESREDITDVSDPRDEGPDPLEDALSIERRCRVRELLSRLPPVERHALEIAYFEGLSHSEIAARLGTPLGTVKTRIRRGMMRLRDMIEEA